MKCLNRHPLTNFIFYLFHFYKRKFSNLYNYFTNLFRIDCAVEAVEPGFKKRTVHVFSRDSPFKRGACPVHNGTINNPVCRKIHNICMVFFNELNSIVVSL